MMFAENLFAAVELVNSVQNKDFSDATSFPEINSPMLLIDDFSTPKKKQSFSQEHMKIDEQEALSMEAKGITFLSCGIKIANPMQALVAMLIQRGSLQSFILGVQCSCRRK